MSQYWQLYVTTLTTLCQTSTWFGLVSEWQGKTMMWPWSRKQPPSKLKYHPFKWLILSYIAVGWKCHRDRLHYNNCCARHRADTNADRMLPTVTTHHLLLSKSGKKADILLINCPLHYKTINGLDFTWYSFSIGGAVVVRACSLKGYNLSSSSLHFHIHIISSIS